MSDSNNGSAVTGMFAAFAVGALLGAGLAILYAPRSGKETREMMGQKAHDLKAAAGEAIEHGKHIVGDVAYKAREAFNKGKEAVHEMSETSGRSV